MAALIASALIVNIFSSTINDSIDRQSNSDDTNRELVGLQTTERWPVLRIAFPGKSFPTDMDEGFFDGEFSAQDYIDQISGTRSSLNVTFIDGVWESPFDESHWGADSEQERDVGSGSGGARQLASNAIESLMVDADLSQWDLDGDGTIDRLLILHSGEAQELGGNPSSIWSHFSTFTEPPELSGYKFEHYTMASIHGGIGVVVHEMLHQMGAVDLYDVHSDTPSRSWHGLGDWDVMSSGNWLDDGNTPSLPSSTTLEIIHAIYPYTIQDMNTMIYRDSSAFGGATITTGDWVPGGGMSAIYTLTPIPEGGTPLKIWLGHGEYLWVTFRATEGFDSGIPGHGIIVEQQDRNYGTIEDNLVNTDPTKPWVRIIEADGDDALMRARDYGSAGDAFREGDSFGFSGHQIWDNTGKLVSFSINVTNMTEDQATIEYYIPYRSFSLTMPRNPIVMLSDDQIFATAVFYDVQCDFTMIFDNSEFSGSETIGEPAPNTTISHTFVIANSSIFSQNTGTGSISGSVGCNGQEFTQISLNWKRVSHRISEEPISAKIKWDAESDVLIYPDSQGTGQMTYSASISGAADRVATVPSQIQFSPGEPIEIHIEPDGLLEPGMIARGELILVSSMNIEYRIPLVLQSQSEFPILDSLEWLSVPSNAITLIFLMLALSVATGPRSED